MQAVHWLSDCFQSISSRIQSFLFCNSSEQFPAFLEEEINEYLSLTHLTRDQIMRAYANFCSHEPIFFSGEKNPYLPKAKAMKMPEFRVNPFKERMMSVFSSHDDYLTFEDYLDMMSVMSDEAPLDLKAEYAFRIYDFDGDDMLSIEDLTKVIEHLKGNQDLSESDVRDAAIQALIDGDVDEDSYLAFTEFLHLVSRIEDFKSSFLIHL